MGPRFSKGCKSRLEVRDFLFWSKVQIFDENGKRLAKKWCFHYNVFSESIVAGNKFILADGTKFDLDNYNPESKIFVVKDYVEDVNGDGTTHYYRVLDEFGKILYSEEKSYLDYSSMDEDTYCISLIAMNDYFVVFKPSGVGIISSDFNQVIPCDYMEIEEREISGERCFVCVDMDGFETTELFSDIGI